MFITRKRSARSQRGDTIVEVLICIGVVGSVLAGAFVVTNRSQLGVRDSQEHAEASKVLESQVEQLRSNGKVQGGEVFDKIIKTDLFCMVDAKPVKYTLPLDPKSNCIVGVDGKHSDAVNAYTVEIQKIDPSSGVQHAGAEFRITVKWAAIQSSGNGGIAQESMVYRIYK